MSEQNRQHARVSARALVRLPDQALGTTRDLSPTGIYLYTATPFEVGEVLQFSIEFDVPDAGGTLYLDCTGSVMRVEPAGAKLGVALSIAESKLVRRERHVATVPSRVRALEEQLQPSSD